MTLTELIQRARDESGIAAASIVSDALFTRYINEAYQELARRRDWPWTQATDWVYTGPRNSDGGSDGGGVSRQGIRISNGDNADRAEGVVEAVYDITGKPDGESPRRLRRRTVDEVGPWQWSDGQYASTGRPEEYFINKSEVDNDRDFGRLYLYPEPDAQYLLQVLIRLVPAPMSTSGVTTPLFDAQFHHILSYMAAVKALVSRGDKTDRPALFTQLATALTIEMERFYLSDHSDVWGKLASDHRPKRWGSSWVARRAGW